MKLLGREFGLIRCVFVTNALRYEMDGQDTYIQIGKNLLVVSRGNTNDKPEIKETNQGDRGV